MFLFLHSFFFSSSDCMILIDLSVSSLIFFSAFSNLQLISSRKFLNYCTFLTTEFPFHSFYYFYVFIDILYLVRQHSLNMFKIAYLKSLFSMSNI